MDDIEALKAEVKRLTAERDAARAVVGDMRLEQGLPDELVQWLNLQCSTRGHCFSMAAGVSVDAAPHCHGRACEGALWARRIGGLEETERQVNAAHEAALADIAMLRHVPQWYITGIDHERRVITYGSDDGRTVGFMDATSTPDHLMPRIPSKKPRNPVVAAQQKPHMVEKRRRNR